MPVFLSLLKDWRQQLVYHAAFRASRPALGFLTAITLSGCVFVPRVSTSYNEDCRIVEKQLDLHMKELELPRLDCSGSGNGCGYVGIVYAGVAVGSAVVSGSIVLVGNTVYWLEEQGKCDWPVVEKIKQFPRSVGVPLPGAGPGIQPMIPVSAQSGD